MVALAIAFGIIFILAVLSSAVYILATIGAWLIVLVVLIGLVAFCVNIWRQIPKTSD